MEHRVDGRSGIDVAWVETKLAKVGNVIRFRDLEGTFKVLEVWGTRNEDYVKACERDYLNQRKVSDI